MTTLIGLGNSEKKYVNNRHNVGYLFIDYLSEQLQKETQPQEIKTRENKLYVCRVYDDLILCKTRTFMNESGKAVQKVIKNLKLEIRNLLVVHDDLDISLGKFKVQKGVGPKLHNGIKSIEQYLHTKNFWRVRIGVDNRNPDQKINGERYVLQNFLPEERKTLKNTFQKIKSFLYLKIKT